MTVLTGSQIPMFQLKVVASAMRLYINTGMKANSAYTPKNMLAFASSVTGKTYPRNGLRQAYNDLRDGCPDAELRAL